MHGEHGAESTWWNGVVRGSSGAEKNAWPDAASLAKSYVLWGALFSNAWRYSGETVRSASAVAPAVHEAQKLFFYILFIGLLPVLYRTVETDYKTDRKVNK